jgi:hypothetical protein
MTVGPSSQFSSVTLFIKVQYTLYSNNRTDNSYEQIKYFYVFSIHRLNSNEGCFNIVNLLSLIKCAVEYFTLYLCDKVYIDIHEDGV